MRYALALTIAVPMLLALAAAPALAQSLDVEVVQDPNAGTATYSIDIDGPPRGSVIFASFMVPFLDPLWYVPGSAFAPLGWNATFLTPPSGLWNWSPVFDPKWTTYAPLNWQNPQAVLKFDAVSPVTVNPGDSLGIFGFKSTQKPVNGPVLAGSDVSGPFLPIDPPVPGPNSVAVPLPTGVSAGLIGLALVGLGVLRRRLRISRP